MIPKWAYQLQGHLNFQGLEVAVENRKGSVRSGKDKDGKPWRTVMQAPYGYLVGTKGKDGEGIDCYVGPHKDAPVAFIVHQHRADGTGFDEDKIVLGVYTIEDARQLYLEHYNDPKFLGPVEQVLVEDLKAALQKRNHMNKVTPRLVRQQLKTAGFLDFFRPSEEDIKLHEAAAAAHDAVLHRGGTGQEAAAAFDRVMTQHHKIAALADELDKLGFVTDDDAHRSLTLLGQIEQTRPKAREMLQDAAVGAAMNPMVSGVARAIETGHFLKGKTHRERLRTLAADAMKGAGGNIALGAALRKSREAGHKKVLKEYVKEVDQAQHHKYAATSVDTLLERLRQRRPDLAGKLAFETSAYNGWGTQGAIRTKEDNPYYFGEVKKIPAPYAQKSAMEESQYSAGTDMGPLNARNNQSFPAPLVRPSPYARQKLADPVAERALQEFEKASMTSPAQMLARSQRQGTAPGALGRRGASIQQISTRPHGAGAGMPDPATTKSAL